MLVNKIDSKSKQYDDGSITGVVLAKTSRQFITWEYSTFDGGDPLDVVDICEQFDSDSINCYMGHYFNCIESAVTDYAKRSNRL